MPTKTKKPVNAGLLTKEPTEVHTSFADYITTTVGVEVEAETVALVQRAYPLYLKSPDVAAAREAEKAAREAEKAAKEQERRARLKARLAKIEAQRQKALKALGIEPDLSVVEEVETVDEFVEPEPEEITLPTAEEEEDDAEDWGDEDDEEDF